MHILEGFISLSIQIPDKREIRTRTIDQIFISSGDNLLILFSYSSSYFLGKCSLSENAACFVLPFMLFFYFIQFCL